MVLIIKIIIMKGVIIPVVIASGNLKVIRFEIN